VILVAHAWRRPDGGPRFVLSRLRREQEIRVQKSVLLVDDSSTLRDSVGLLLRDAGYRVEEAEDGERALQLLDGRHFDLVICDLHMPHLDGIGFVRRMKAHPFYGTTPVMMLTMEDGRAWKDGGKAAGVAAWLTKPFPAYLMMAAAARLCPP
jgi:two-component system, chemotaxis family, chemotaxis protein CheY